MTGDKRRKRNIPPLLAAVLLFLAVIFAVFAGCSGPGCDRGSGTDNRSMRPGQEDKNIQNDKDERSGGVDNGNDTSSPLNNIEDVRKALDRGDLDLDRAWRILEPLLAKNPGDMSLLTIKARLLWSMDKYDQALKTFDYILSKEPDNAFALSFKTRILLDNFKTEEARKAMEHLLAIDPGSLENRILKARVLFQSRDYKGAEGILLPIIKKEPGNIDAALFLVDIYDRNKQTDEAIGVVQNILKTGSPGNEDKSQLLTRLGDLMERKGKTEEEYMKYFQEALKLDPQNTQAKSRLAFSMTDMSDPVKFRKQVEKSLESKITTPFQLYALAELDFNDGKIQMGKAALFKAIKMFPLEVTGYNILGYITFDFKEYYTAQTAYAHSKRLNPGDYNESMGEALLAIVRRDFKSANTILASIDPPEHRECEHFLRLGDCYMDHLRDYDTGRKYFLKAIEKVEKKGDSIVPYINLGNIELLRNNDAEAEKYFRKALDQGDVYAYAGILLEVIENRRYQMAEKYLSEWRKKTGAWGPRDRSTIFLGCDDSYLMNGDLEYSQKMIALARKADPTDPMVDQHLAKVYLALGQYDKAKPLLEKTLEKFPDEYQTIYYRGLISEEEGDMKSTEKYYSKARECYRGPGDLDYLKAQIFSVGRKKDKALKALRKSIDEDAFNACRAYCDEAWDWMRDDDFFKKEIPVLITKVKNQTMPPPENLPW
ncbi:MAG: tetratricopeptide repeat protein [Chloroflexi bacterium]|nr:tetratricopeptide repeat protein [Chloroflexota bacterium]